MRQSGQDTELTDQELLTLPPRMLSAGQRRRRRKLRNDDARKRRQRVRKKRADEGRVKVIYCQGTNKNGDPCGSYAVDGAKHCISHLNEAERAKTGKKTLKEYHELARLAQPEVNGVALNGPQALRSVFEVALEKCVSRYFQATGFHFEGWDDKGMPIVRDLGANKGLCLYGESKEGYINMTQHPDLAAQIQVLEKMMDRVYGKPKQTQVLEGGIKPIQVQPVRTVERAHRVADLLRDVGAIPHSGRRRSHPGSDTDVVTTVNSEPDNVVPLNDSEG